MATSWCDWMQWDGAMVHAAVRVNEWLEGKFGDRVISKFSDLP